MYLWSALSAPKPVSATISDAKYTHVSASVGDGVKSDSPRQVAYDRREINVIISSGWVIRLICAYLYLLAFFYRSSGSFLCGLPQSYTVIFLCYYLIVPFGSLIEKQCIVGRDGVILYVEYSVCTDCYIGMTFYI